MEKNRKEAMNEEIQIRLPVGKFNYCYGNCECCRYYYSRDTDRNGRGYCSHYGSYYFPRERQGCRSHKCEN